ncbi:hypothetical protein FOZ63_021367, partial [Perkinsus olseni]
GRPSLSSLVEFIKKNMPAVDVASATLRKHYRPKPQEGEAQVPEESESATASAYDDNLRKVMDTTAATASRISSKLGESSTKFFSSFVGGLSAAVTAGGQSSARTRGGGISLGTPLPPPPPPEGRSDDTSSDSSVEGWIKKLGVSEKAAAAGVNPTADIKTMVADTFAAAVPAAAESL